MDNWLLVTLLILGGVLFIGGVTALQLFANNYVNKVIWCVVCHSMDTFHALLSEFKAQNIFYNLKPSSPSQEAYYNPAMVGKCPSEIWIQKSAKEKARSIIESKYRLEITETAYIVHEKGEK